MKKPSDNLFRLIQSMTPAEKRYFKMHFASEQSKLTELFDFINRMTEYHEEQVKHHFRENLSKNLKVHKIQLQELLLKSLTAYRSKKSVRSKIRTGLEEVDILMEKRLYELAEDKLKKVKKLARKYEEDTYLVEIGYQELVLQYLRIEKVGMSRHPVFGEIRQQLRILQQQFDLNFLGNQLNDRARATVSRIPETEKEQLRERLKEYPLNLDVGELSFHSRILFFGAHAFVHKLLGEKEKEFHYRRLSYELFTREERFQQSMAFNYLAVMRNYINACLVEKHYEEVLKAVARAREFGEKHGNLQLQITHFHEAELEAFFRQYRFLDIRNKLEDKILRHVKRYQLGKERIVLMMYFYLAITHQVLGNHAGVQVYIRRLHLAKADLWAYFAEVIYILELINHFESGDDFLVIRTLKSIKRQKEKMPPWSSFFSDLMTLFQELVRQPFDRQQIVSAFKEQVDRYKNEFTFIAFRHFMLECWLDAVMEKRPFAEQVCRQARAEKEICQC